MKRILIITIVIILTSCTSQLYLELNHIHKGMNIDEVNEVVTNGDYGTGIELFNDDINEDLYTYENNIKYLVTAKLTPYELEYYVFVFQNEKLVYWGLPYQIANHSNLDISNSSFDISKNIKEKYID